MSAARKLLGELLALPEAERAEIALELAASFDGAADDGWEAAWLAELDRRAAAPAAMETWPDIRARLLSRTTPR